MNCRRRRDKGESIEKSNEERRETWQPATGERDRMHSIQMMVSDKADERSGPYYLSTLRPPSPERFIKEFIEEFTGNY